MNTTPNQPDATPDPGGWRVDNHPRREYPRVTDARGRFVADCVEEHAHLIAEAPELLGLLRGVLKTEQDAEGRIVLHGWQVDVLRAALAKVKTTGVKHD